MVSAPPSGPPADRLVRRGFWLEYATLLWNVVGTVVVIRTAIHMRSAALAGFSLRVRLFSDAAARLGPELA